VPASYFDVDGTLVRTNLLHPTLFYLLNQQTPLRSLGKLARAAFRAPRMAVAELQDRRLFNELLFSSYEGMSRDRLLLLADEAFDTVIKRALYPNAKELVARSRAQGHDVILVSGALDFLMEPLVKHLGATSFIANRLEFSGGIATGKLVRPVVAGPEKAKLLRDHARSNGHDLDDCFAYSDSYSDVPMLSVVGHPAAVNPDYRLAHLAAAHGWPVLNLERPS
jgi:HAD superfamily hydrolase (TIGR01490 family)